MKSESQNMPDMGYVANPNIDAALTAILLPDEKVLWCLPLGNRLIRNNMRRSWWLWGILLLILVGLLLVSGWLVRAVLALLFAALAVHWYRRYPRWRRNVRSAGYVVTNRRAIILAPIHHIIGPWQLKPQIVSVYPAELKRRRIIAEKGGRGTGDVIFWERKFLDNYCEHIFTPILSIAFEAVPNVAGVDALLNKLVESAGPDTVAEGVAPDSVRCENVGRDLGDMLKPDELDGSVMLARMAADLEKGMPRFESSLVKYLAQFERLFQRFNVTKSRSRACLDKKQNT